jgi:MFS family permease
MVGLGILAASRATTLVHMYVVYAFIGCGLAAATVIACSLIVSNWFVSRRGMAMGVMAMGTSTGGMVMGPVAGWIIQNHSWRAAYLFSGSMILLVGLPLVIFIIKPRPADVGLDPYVDPDLPAEEIDMSWGLTIKEAFSTSAFWQIAAIMFIIGLVTSGLGMHIVPCLTDMDHSPAKAVGIWSIALGVMTVSKFLFGPIADRVGPKNAIAAACALMAVSIIILSFAARYEAAILFGVLYGLGVGAPLTVNPLLVGKSLGVKHFGAIYGVLNLVSIIGAAFGPITLGFIYDARESYLLGLYAFVGMMAITAGIALFVNSTARDASEALRPQSADAID